MEFARTALSRRELMRRAAAGVAAASLPFGAERPPYGPFRMGIQSYTLRHFSTEEALKITQSLGLKFWEAYPGHFSLTESPETIAQYKALLKKYDVKLVTYGVVGFGNNEAETKHTFEFARLMGIETLSAYPSPDAFDLLDKYVNQYKINIAIHNHGPGDNLYDKIDKLTKAIAGRNPRIGSCDDTGHYLRSDENPVEAARQFGKRLYGVHLKDVVKLPGGGHAFTELGKGDLDTVGLLKVMKANGFKGLVSLEYEEHEENPTPYIAECLAATRAAINRAIEMK